MTTRKPLVLAGPTGSGKSGLALALAAAHDGAIICADSRQVYAHMRIGAAGPTDDELQQVWHLGYHEVAPHEVFAAGDFISRTDAAIAEVQAAGKWPLLVGGTGLYLRAWRFGLDDVPRADPALRQKLEDDLAEKGSVAMHQELADVDPESAAAITPTDPVRIVRALEVFAMTGQKASTLRTTHFSGAPRHDADFVLLNPDRAWLVPRIEQRARQMFDDGLVDEAVALRAVLHDVEGDAPHRLLQTMGYEEALKLHDGAMTSEEALEQTFIRQRQFARRQRTWFKKETWWEVFDIASDADLQAVLRTLLERQNVQETADSSA